MCLMVFVFSCFTMPVADGAYAANKSRSGRAASQQKKEVPAKETEASQDAAAQKGASNANPDAPISANSRSAVLVEVSSGKPLFEQNADNLIEPASFTKVLTLYLIFEALQKGIIHLNDEVFISKEAWETGGSKMFVDIGSKVLVEELIKGIAVVSGNDACVAMAEHISGSVDAFVAAMNQKAEELGMANSRFFNPHGLPVDGQITTAADMARLGTSYLQHFPESLRFHSMHEYTYNNISQTNRNRLLFKDETVDGLKTGYVTAGGYHLAATSTRDGMRLLAVVMGAVSPHVREVEAMKLLSYGFHHYALLQPFSPNEPISKVKLWKGIKDQLDLFPVETVSLLAPRTKKNAFKWDVNVPVEAAAPIHMSQPLGEVKLYLDGEVVKTVALVSKEEVAQAGFFKRVWHTILQIHKINWALVGGIAGGALLTLLLLFFILTRRSYGRRRSRTRGF